jgi:hypothetical protein
MGIVTQISMRPAVPLPEICFATMAIPSPGSPSSRRPFRYRPPKLNTILHRRRPLKASGFVTSFVLVDSRVLDRLRCTRTTPRASSGAATSSEDVNLPSTSTLARIMHMKLSSSDTFGWCTSRLVTSLRMRSPRACLLFSIGRASPAFNAVHGRRKDRVPHEGKGKDTFVLAESEAR